VLVVWIIAIMHSRIAAVANHLRSSFNPIGKALANGPRMRLRFRRFKSAGCHPIESRTNSSFQRANSDWVVVVRVKPTVIPVVRVVSIVFAKRELHAGAAHPERHELEDRRCGMGRLEELPVKPLGVPRKGLGHFQPVLLGHRLKSRDAASFHDIESQAASHEVEVLHHLAPSVDSLGYDVGEGLPVEAWSVEHEPEPVKKSLHDRGDLERVVRRGKNDRIGGHHLLNEHIPVVLEGAALFAPEEASLAAATQSKVVLAEKDDLTLNVSERL
jgi:hypothetical protein